MTKRTITKVCIIGCGTYGSYLIRRLTEKLGEGVQITAIEIGDAHIKNEKEMGVEAESLYAAASFRGRYFGLGGTSARWGGQVLFFDERDNPNKDPNWNDIIAINQQYRKTVLNNLLGSVTAKMDDPGEVKQDVKTGIWLKYSKRNIFKQLDRKTTQSIEVLKNLRVVDFVFQGDTIKAVVCRDKGGNENTIEADVFYLTAGAIESCRLLLDIDQRHAFLPANDLGKHYGDHLSVELFRVKGRRPILGGQDFLPRLYKGSLITKRIVVRSQSGRIGFAHFIYNKEVKVFSSIKKALFGVRQIDFNAHDVLDGFVFLVKFGFSVFFLKKMYAHHNNWSLQLEIEQAFPNGNEIGLSDKVDQYGVAAAKLDWEVSEDDRHTIAEIKSDLARRLEKEGIPYEDVYDSDLGATKIEDVYHPAGFIRMGNDGQAVLDLDGKVKGVANLYHFSTAMFPSAKSTSPTAAGFCFVEHHLDSCQLSANSHQTTTGGYQLEADSYQTL